MKKNLLFVGDSFCAAFAGPSEILHEPGLQYHPYYDSWLDVSARSLDLNLFSFGYAGRSWWFSRDRFLKNLHSRPGLIENTEVIVFVHTDSYRYNSTDQTIGLELLNHRQKDLAKRSLAEHQTAMKYWLAFLKDDNFQVWTHQQWFREIKDRFGLNPSLKIINFFAFDQTIEFVGIDLPGVIYTTPLAHISMCETADIQLKNQGFEKMWLDQRVNHFSDHNNRALGNVLIETVNDYRPGARPMDITGFDIDRDAFFGWQSN